MLELQRAGTSVYAICRPQSKVEAFLRGHGILYTFLPGYGPVDLKAIRFLRDLIRDKSVDAVHVHFHADIWPASLALRGMDDVLLMLGVYMGVSSKRDPWHWFVYHRVDAIFTSAPALFRRLPRLYPVPKKKVHLLRYGRRMTEYCRDEERRRSIRARYGIGDEEMLVGTMVRIDPGKGVMDFARSFQYLDDDLRSRTRYLVVGEPTRRARAHPGESPFEPHCEAYLREIESFIKDQGLERRIILAGFQTDLIGFLSALDLFVFPSRDELYSLVVLDAMAMGLPVVAARAGGNIDQIEEGVSGLLYDVSNSEDAARKIEKFLHNESYRKSCGEAARSFVARNHDMEKIIQQLIKCYKKIPLGGDKE